MNASLGNTLEKIDYRLKVLRFIFCMWFDIQAKIIAKSLFAIKGIRANTVIQGLP